MTTAMLDRLTATLCMIVMGVFVTVVALSRSPVLSGGALVFAGAAWTASVTVFNVGEQTDSCSVDKPSVRFVASWLSPLRADTVERMARPVCKGFCRDRRLISLLQRRCRAALGLRSGRWPNNRADEENQLQRISFPA
jgi:hypothetical protein